MVSCSFSFSDLLCVVVLSDFCVFFFFKQKTAYEMRISDWSSDVCSSDLLVNPGRLIAHLDDAWDRRRQMKLNLHKAVPALQKRALETHRVLLEQIGRASCRERVCQYV